MADVKYLTNSKEYKVFLSPLEHKVLTELLRSISVFETDDEKLLRQDLLHSFTHYEKF